MKNPVLAHFGPIFPIFGAKTIFLGNPALSRTTSHGNLAPCKDLEKLNNTIPRKDPDGRMEGQKDGGKDGQALFYRTLSVTARGPTKHDYYY